MPAVQKFLTPGVRAKIANIYDSFFGSNLEYFDITDAGFDVVDATEGRDPRAVGRHHFAIGVKHGKAILDRVD